MPQIRLLIQAMNAMKIPSSWQLLHTTNKADLTSRTVPFCRLANFSFEGEAVHKS